MGWPFSRSKAPLERVEPTLQNSSPFDNPSTSLSNPAPWLVEGLGGSASYAGPMVNEQSAMRSSAVFRCVTLISGLIASLPLGVYEKTKAGREEALNNRLYFLLHDEPNNLMGSFTWRQMLAGDLLLGGNHYSLIERDNANRVVGFFPLYRNMVRVSRVGGRNKYQVDTDKGLVVLDQADVLHIPGYSFDGLCGLSPIQWAGKQVIGNHLAITEYIGRTHANGARPSVFIEVPAGIAPEAFKALKAQFLNEHQGLHNMGRPYFGDAGSKPHPLQMTLADSQTLEALRYAVADICRIFGVPPDLLGEMDKSSSWGTGVEQRSLGFLRFTLEPWLKCIEDEFKRKLFSNSRYYAEFDRDALLAMDAAAATNMFASGIQNGWLKPSEVRHMKNLPADPAADQLLCNGTLRPLSQAGVEAAPKPGETPAQPQPEPGANPPSPGT